MDESLLATERDKFDDHSQQAHRHVLTRQTLLEQLSDDRDESPLTEDDEVRVIIGYRNDYGKRSIAQQQRASAVSNDAELIEFRQVKAVATSMIVSELYPLAEDPNIEYIERDEKIRAAGLGDAVPYGVKVTHGLSSATVIDGGSQPSSGSENRSAPCNDPSSLRVAIIDSGVQVSHPDLPCHLGSDICIGRDYTGMDGGDWDTPTNPHGKYSEHATHLVSVSSFQNKQSNLSQLIGTHVMGTIAALGNNDLGVVGMTSHPDQNVCYIIPKVLDSEGSGYVSDILAAVEWAVVEKGAKVVNLSISGWHFIKSASDLYNLVTKSYGALVVAAAGNEGTKSYSYPASYDPVISCAAIGEGLSLASFSNRNNKIDFAAPGRNVLSTVLTDMNPLKSTIATVTTSGGTIAGVFVRRKRIPLSGVLAECDGIDCQNVDGRICVMKRYVRFGVHLKSSWSSNTLFLTAVALCFCSCRRASDNYTSLARTCQEAGGLGVVVYHSHYDENYRSGYVDKDVITIPVIGVSLLHGQLLLREYLGTNVMLDIERGYAFWSGTSMAAPHVAGAIAGLWQECPSCTNFQIESCLAITARDLGIQGRDDKYGHGLIQVQEALQCLANEEGCCELIS